MLSAIRTATIASEQIMTTKPKPRLMAAVIGSTRLVLEEDAGRAAHARLLPRLLLGPAGVDGNDVARCIRLRHRRRRAGRENRKHDEQNDRRPSFPCFLCHLPFPLAQVLHTRPQ